MAFPIAAIVVSPAESRDRTSSGATSAVISPLSTESHIAAPMLPSDSASRAHCAVIQGTTFAACAIDASTRALRGPMALKTMSP